MGECLENLPQTVLVKAPAERSGESEARLRQCYESTPAMLHMLGMDGSIQMVSDLWLRGFDYRRDEVIGRHITEFLTYRSLAYSENEVFPHFLQVGFVDDIDYQMIRRNGEVVDVLISAVLERDESGEPAYILGAIKDVTMQRAAERALDAEHSRLSNILEGTHAATWEWNVQTGATLFNERYAQIVGLTLADLGSHAVMQWRRLIHPEDRPRYELTLKAHLAAQTDRSECELRIRHRNGSWVWVYDCGTVRTWTPEGKPEWICGTRIDISERKRQEEALRKSKDFLDRTGAVAGVGGWQVDLTTNNLEWSLETYRIHGLDPATFKPTVEEAIDFYAPEARAAITDAIARATVTGSDWDLELPLIRSDGQRITVRTVGTASFEGDRPVRLSGAVQDITESRRLAAELAQQHELLRVTLQSIGDAVITVNAEGSITWLNPVAERLTGWTSAEAVGLASRDVFRIVNDKTSQPAADPIARCLAEGRVVGLEHDTLLISRDGSEFGIEDSASPIRSEQGDVLGVVLVFHDVSEQRRLASEISHRASHDGLTGLLNRGEFELRLAALLQRTNAEKGRTERCPGALLYLDLDQFKIVNDTCGHGPGDQLLIQVSRLLTGSIRVGDTVARLGGDEFAVILEDCPMSRASIVAQAICDRMGDFRFLHEDRRFRVGASVGLVSIDERWPTAAAILQAADSSCYAAKQAGRNRVHTWQDTDEAMAARQGDMHWASRLEQALDQDHFELYAQQYTSLGDQAGVHAEVLLRMVEPEGDIVSASAFMPAGERFHLATRVDRWVVQKVLDWMRSLDAETPLACLNVNLSGQSVGDSRFHEWTIAKLAEIDPHVRRRLCFEITETAAVTNLVAAEVFIEQLRELEVRVALDDFGSGASWFGYFSRMPVQLLKIDGQFTHNLVNNRLNEATVRCFADIARVLKIQTVAECVEDPATLIRLREMGIDFAQGYLLHQPGPIAELASAQKVPA